ncbi:MAG: phosphoribosylamine--glycine ligase [Clostridia bacterium]|nr:phosphoribosylamine--glycine ligase [Clostridia bacterium]
MNILVVGGGGREHAIIKKLKESKKVTKIFATPGNGGIASDAVCAAIGAKDIDGIVKFAVENKIDFAVVAPDDPLVLGAVDALHKVGIKCFGPCANAAIIEGSKVFSKDLMKKYGIPTARYESFNSKESAIEYLEGASFPIVIKADGLALGKGVVIAEDLESAKAAVVSMMEDKIFGESGSNVVIEQFLKGVEVSVLAFTDGKTVVPMVSSMDHKRALDNDKGDNTGGMGTVAPNPYYTPEIADICMRDIFIPTMQAMNKEGRVFKGCLYFGLMICDGKPYVIEYNCRFGDPETQVVLPLLKSDLLEIMLAVEEERLADVNVEFDSGAACCVVIASGGYPKKYQTGMPIDFSNVEDKKNVVVYHAGTRLENGAIVTSGGRVLGVTATADTLEKAIELAYDGANAIKFENMHKRSDIGQTALKALK